MLTRAVVAGAGQLQDLHSKLVLDHPRGEADQLHKCIASASNARGVFDGNVKVSTAYLSGKVLTVQLARSSAQVQHAHHVGGTASSQAAYCKQRIGQNRS